MARSGQIVLAVTSVNGEHALTMTIALVRLVFVTLPLDDFRILPASPTHTSLSGINIPHGGVLDVASNR